jgi:hypothetical protein
MIREQLEQEYQQQPRTNNNDDYDNRDHNRGPRRTQRTNYRRFHRRRQPRHRRHPYERHSTERPARRAQQNASPHTRWQTNRERFCQEIARDMRHHLDSADAESIYIHVGHKTGLLQLIEDEMETPIGGRSMHYRLASMCRRNINHLVEQRHRVGGARVNSGDMELIVNYV